MLQAPVQWLQRGRAGAQLLRALVAERGLEAGRGLLYPQDPVLGRRAPRSGDRGVYRVVSSAAVQTARLF